MALRTISLFAGGAGLDLGIELAVPDARTVCYVEREAYAAATLVARMEKGDLAPAPIWGDVSTFDGTPWRGRVDLVCGGFPCQDVSNAGTRTGLAGARSGLWREYARILGEARPDLVFVENVSALRSRGLDIVLTDLASLGFDAEWSCYRASDVGAPHRRERIFILAYRIGFELRKQSWWRGGSRGSGKALTPDAGNVMADSDSNRLQSVGRGRVHDGRAPQRHDVNGPRGTTSAVGNEWAPWPPGPEELDHWREYLRLRPDAEPAVCRGSHGMATGLVDRADRLRLLGNGVVPQVAAMAFLELLQRAST